MKPKKRLISLCLLLIVGLFCIAYYVKFNTVIKVYNDFESFKSSRLRLPEKQEPITLIAVGDIMLSRYVAKKINEFNEPGYPFTNINWFLQSGDITFGNLENPITPGRNINITEMILRADPHMASALKDAGFDILSLANNHLPDFGEQGVLDTMQYLRDVNIDYVGIGKNKDDAYKPRYINVNDFKLAFLAFTDPDIAPDNYSANDGPGTAALKPDRMTTEIEEAAANADFTVVYLHLGTEYASEPDESQVYYSKLSIDAGADLVIGSHPHVVQKADLYKGKYILHSLGNLIFDQLWSEETRESVAVKISIGEKGVERMEFLPLYINDNAQPVVLDGEAGQEVIKKLGLHLNPEPIPVWDGEKKEFMLKSQYVLTAAKMPRKYRLTQSRQHDLDGDGKPEEYILKDGCLTIKDCSDIIWESPKDWWIESFFIGDATNNGKPELCLSVWKEGSFGPYKPFWVDEEDTDVKNHLFIFKLENNILKPVWQSSNLDYPIIHADLMDLDGDGENELVVREGSYTDPKRHEITLWKWSDWGFKLFNKNTHLLFLSNYHLVSIIP